MGRSDLVDSYEDFFEDQREFMKCREDFMKRWNNAEDVIQPIHIAREAFDIGTDSIETIVEQLTGKKFNAGKRSFIIDSAELDDDKVIVVLGREITDDTA